MPLEQPKKPVGGAYGIFLAKNRADFTAATKGQKASAVTKLAGEKWKKLTDKDKEPFEKEYKLAKEKYDKDMKAFLDGGGEKQKGTRALAAQKRKDKEEEGGGGKRRKVAKDPNRPKKPAGGAYGVFLNKNRKEFAKESTTGITGVTKIASARWKELSEAQRKPYQDDYEKLNAAFKEAMKTYKPPAGDGKEEEDEDDEGEEEEAA